MNKAPVKRKTAATSKEAARRFPWRITVPVAILLIGLCLSYVYSRYQVIAIGYVISDANRRLDKAGERNHHLQRERSGLVGLDRLLKKAAALGLVEPKTVYKVSDETKTN